MTLVEGHGGVYQLLVDQRCVYDKRVEDGRLPTARELIARLSPHLSPRPGALEALDDEDAEQPGFCTWAPPDPRPGDDSSGV